MLYPLCNLDYFKQIPFSSAHFSLEILDAFPSFDAAVYSTFDGCVSRCHSNLQTDKASLKVGFRLSLKPIVSSKTEF